MPHNNEQGIDQWVEENGKTRYQEFDGTERKDDTPYLDGGIVGGLLDNADRDMHDAFLQDNADRVQRYIGIAIQKAKEDGEDPIEAAHEAVNYYDEYGLSDTEIEAMIENALNPPPKTWTIGFRLNGEPNIKTHTTTAKDGLSAWEGGIIGGLQDQDLDTADRDYARSYKFIYNKIDSALYEAAANALENLNISLTAAKEVAADAIAKAVTECKTLYDFYEYDDLAKYNLDAAIIDWQLFGKKKVTP